MKKNKLTGKRQRYFRVNESLNEFLGTLIADEVNQTCATRGVVTKVILSLQQDRDLIEKAVTKDVIVDRYAYGRTVYADDDDIPGIKEIMKRTGMSMTKAINAILEARQELQKNH
jgi:hypothetical protein